MLSVVFVISSPALSVFGSGAAMAPHNADSTKAKHSIRLAFMMGLGVLRNFCFFTSSQVVHKIVKFSCSSMIKKLVFIDLEKPSSRGTGNAVLLGFLGCFAIIYCLWIRLPMIISI